VELLLCCVALVGGRALVNGRRRRRSKSTPEEIPAVHVGVLDDADTGEWLSAIADDPDEPIDAYDAALRDFNASVTVAVSDFDQRFFSVIGPQWAAAVRNDQYATGEFRRIVRAVLESTDEYLMVGVG
jgi:hypothetical protein